MNALFSIVFQIFQLLGKILFDFYGWVPIVAVLGFLIYQNTRKQQWISDTDFTLLLIEVPKDNEKQELSAEQMFASLHGILRPKQELIKEGAIQEHISFEIVSVNKQIRFYIWAPKHLKNFIEGQVYAQYPSVQIQEVAEDYVELETPQDGVYGAELTLTNPEVLPIRTFKSFEVDPLAGITAVLAKPEEKNEQLWIQILARPVNDKWHARGESYIQSLREGKTGGLSSPTMGGVAGFLGDVLKALWAPPNQEGESKDYQMSDSEKALVQATNEKIGKLGYEVTIRLMHTGSEQNLSRLRIQSLVGAFKQFNTTSNGFKVDNYLQGEEALQKYRARLFAKSGQILNIEELASLYHLPHTNVETPSMVWARTKTAEPPSNLPSVENVPAEELSPIGQTNFRGNHTQFGLKRSDRSRHVYVVGQTGTGKSYLLELMTLSDIFYDHGFAIIDPHGDFATDILHYIPQERVDDVIYFNPADTKFPIAFNPMEVTDDSLKGHIASEIVGVLKRMFGYSWGPRLEYILRYTLLALLDYPNSTMLDITRMLTEKDFRQKVIDQVDDPVVKNFWVNEFGSWNQRFASEAVSPILNKVGAFTANPLVRNIVGQPKSAFDIRKLMDQGKILIVNLSRGQVGEDNAATLGALMVTKIQLAAMSRANLENLEQRRPFYLYVDEFQQFATDSFAVILSEARKYGLNLTIANQYVAQMSEDVRDAVFGNVGNMVLFRIGADDAQYLEKYVTPTFERNDMVNLHNRHFIMSMSIEGEKVPPFTATSLKMPPPQANNAEAIIKNTREKYARPQAEVAGQISEWAGPDQAPNKNKQNQKSSTQNQKQAAEPKAASGEDEFEQGQTINIRRDQ